MWTWMWTWSYSWTWKWIEHEHEDECANEHVHEHEDVYEHEHKYEHAFENELDLIISKDTQNAIKIIKYSMLLTIITVLKWNFETKMIK